MRKEVVAGLIIATSLSTAPAAYAHCPGVGQTTGLSHFVHADSEAVKRFQKETILLRDELISKLELRKEFSKRNPDKQRIATLRKEMTDIKARILQKADEAGINTGGRTVCGRTLGRCII